jgi:hypothetical protein
MECRKSILKLSHNRLLPNPLQFIVHFSPFLSTLYSLNYLKSSETKKRKNTAYNITDVHVNCVLDSHSDDNYMRDADKSLII